MQVSELKYIPVTEKVNWNRIRNKSISPSLHEGTADQWCTMLMLQFLSLCERVHLDLISEVQIRKDLITLEKSAIGLVCIWVKLALQFGLPQLLDRNIWPWALKCLSMCVGLRTWTVPWNSSQFKHVSKCLKDKRWTFF